MFLQILNIWFVFVIGVCHSYTNFGDATFPTGYLLPNSIQPLEYNVTIIPNWNVNILQNGPVKSFKGEVVIMFKALHVPLDYIILNSKYLRFDDVSLALKNGNASFLSDVWEDQNDVQIQKVDTSTNVIYADNPFEMARINLNEPLNSLNMEYRLTIKYHGSISTTTNGFYSSSYTNNQGKKEYLLSTQFEPNYARMAFPCLDEPSKKARFTVQIERPSGRNVSSMSNMPLRYSLPVENDQVGGGIELVRDYFEQSVKMSTYLVAFVISRYPGIYNVTKGGVKVGVHTPPDQIDQAQFALSVASQALDFYDEYFQIPFPLPKLDLAAIPDFSQGAMENWGLVTYRMVDLLYKAGQSPSSVRESIAGVISHELAHQWFGNLVTMRWWNDLWLNEGFATYMSYICAAHIFPDWGIELEFGPDTASKALFLDAFAGSHPVSYGTSVITPTDIQSMFDFISYSKGSILLGMLDGTIMSKTDFRTGIHKYLKSNAYSNAQASDLWEALQKSYNPTLADLQSDKKIRIGQIMHGWIHRKGFPLVTLNDIINESNQSLSLPLGQSKFESQYTTISFQFQNLEDYVWDIPLTLIIGIVPMLNNYENNTISGVSNNGINNIGKVNHLIWLDKSTYNYPLNFGDANFNIHNIWVKANTNYTGYYLVQYGPTLWANLLRQLKTNIVSFTPLDLAQLIDNVFSLARFGYISYTNALDFSIAITPDVLLLNPQTDFSNRTLNFAAVPLIQMLNNMESLQQLLGLYNSPLKLYKRYYNTQFVKPIYDKLNFKKWSNDLSPLHNKLQTKVIAATVMLGYKETIQNAKEIFKSWLQSQLSTNENDTYTMPFPDLEAPILYSGIRYGTPEDWILAWNVCKTSTIPSLAQAIRKALTYTNRITLLEKLLSYVYNGLTHTHTNGNYIRTQDVSAVLQNIARNSPIGGARVIVWEFLKQHWELFVNVYGDSSNSLSSIVRGICMLFDRPEMLAEYEEFVATKIYSKKLLTNNLYNDNDDNNKKLLRPDTNLQVGNQLLTNDTLTYIGEIIRLNIAFRKNNLENITLWLNQHTTP